MTDQSKAKIFLAEERGIDESESFRKYQTFNYQKYFNEFKVPFGNLYVLNDDSFAGGYSETMMVEEQSLIILIPVVGAINYADSIGNTNTVKPGELQVVLLPAGSNFGITNCYESELINMLQFRLRCEFNILDSVPLLFGFDLEENKNSLIEVVNSSSMGLRLNIGQFRGREEASYKVADSGNSIFVFVIEGAFEVNGRLLQPRDGLALWDITGPIDMEALSNEAIVCVLEV